MKVISKALGAIVLIFAVLSCSSIGRLAEKQVAKQLDKGMKTNKVDSLWQDVPKMDGLGESLNDQLPLAVNVILRGFVNLVFAGMNADDKNKDGKQEHNPVTVDFIFFNYKGTDIDIDKFYTAERMKAAGNWDLKEGMDKPCLDGGAEGAMGHACIFQKLENGKQQGLIILYVPNSDKNKKDTDPTAFIYFFRASTDPMNAPAQK